MTNTISKRPTTQQKLTRIWPMLAIVGLLMTLTAGHAWSSENDIAPDKTNMIVYKTPACGCCDKWVAYLEENNFNVEINLVSETNTIRTRLGVPREMTSCHTAMVGDYWVEGHVPADLIHKLMTERPEGTKGIAAPGMPQGSPGMESQISSTYYILSVNNEGESEVYATRKGQNAH